MICPYCGKENPKNIAICDFCGGPLTIPAEQPVSQDAIPEPSTSAEAAPETPVLEQLATEEPAPTEIKPALKVPIQPAKQAATGIYGNRVWWCVGCFIALLLIVGCAAIAWALTTYPFTKILDTLLPTRATPTVSSFIPINETPAIVPSLPIVPTQGSIVTITPIPLESTPGVLFFDDFSDPNSGWDSVDQADFYTDYYDNAYRIIVYSDMSDSWANPGDRIFADVRIEVDATKNGGPDDNDFGVICRYLGTDQFYYAVISSDGYYGITKVTGETSTLLGSESLQSSDAIKLGEATNHILFDCVGDVLTLYVNGEQLEQQNDDEYTEGNIGLIAGTYDVPGTDILFDNFSVYQP